MAFQVVVSCVETPCLKCRSRGEKGYFITPCANGRFESKFMAEQDANICQRTTGKDGKHRYDVAELRGDGWMLCPWCDDDELWTDHLQPTLQSPIAGCYRCGTTLPPGIMTRDPRPLE